MNGVLAIWPRLAQTATWLTGVVLQFVWVPAHLTLSDATGPTAVKVVQFAIAVVAGIIIIVFSLRDRKGRTGFWIAACLIALGAGLFAYDRYDRLSAAWTCRYYNSPPLVVGYTYKPLAARYMATRPDASCSDLLRDFAGNNMRVWSEHEIRERHRNLKLTFSAVVLAFSLTIMFLLEAFRSAQKRG